MLVQYKRTITVIAVIILIFALSACKSANIGASDSNDYSVIQPSDTSLSTIDITSVTTETIITNRSSETTDTPTIESASPIPNRRISVVRPGTFSVLQTESGLYVTVKEKVAAPGNEYFDFVLYCDHASDEFVKLCGRTDCPHNTTDCDACLGTIIPPMGYYDGSLYYFQYRAIDKTASHALFKMDPDGRNKNLLLSLNSDKQEAGRATRFGGIQFFNGFFMMSFGQLDKDGLEQMETQFTNLNQPEALKPTALEIKKPFSGQHSVLLSSGDVVLLMDETDGDQSTSQQGERIYSFLYAWDPVSNSLEPIGDMPNQGGGYYDREGGLFIQEGKIFRWHYENHQTALLFDTGLTGKHRLYCYPDCLVVSEYRNWDEEETDTVSLWFYNWDYRYLGSCQVRFAEKGWYPEVIMEETETRILLGNAGMIDRPFWYIEKSDFGKDEIPLHEYHYPEMELLE